MNAAAADLDPALLIAKWVLLLSILAKCGAAMFFFLYHSRNTQ